MAKKKRVVASSNLTMPEDFKNDLASIRSQEAAKRVITVAFVTARYLSSYYRGCGPLRVLFIGPPGQGKTSLITAADELATSLNLGRRVAFYEAWPCACGGHNDPRRSCDCLPSEVTKLSHTDIYCEVPCVPAAELFASTLMGTSSADVFNTVARIEPLEDVSAMEHPTREFSRSVIKLASQVYAERALSVDQLYTAARVSYGIAAMMGKSSIEETHFIEAANYVPYQRFCSNKQSLSCVLNYLIAEMIDERIYDKLDERDL